MVYIVDRLGTSQQIMIDAVAEEIESPSATTGSPRRPTTTRRDGTADRPVGHPVRPDRRTHSRLGRPPKNSPTHRTDTLLMSDLTASTRPAAPPTSRRWETGAIDVVVIGGGIIHGHRYRPDAASRGLSVVLVEKHDLAFGTSRWSPEAGARRAALSGDRQRRASPAAVPSNVESS